MMVNKSFILGIASALSVAALAGGAFYLGKSNSTTPQNVVQVASEANGVGVPTSVLDRSSASSSPNPSLVPHLDSIAGQLDATLKNKTVLFKQLADLDGDGKLDALVVVESAKKNADGNALRTVQIYQQIEGELKLVAQNDNAVMCAECKGPAGSFFDKPMIVKKGFVIVNEGGSRERWSNKATFKYSRIDNTWQLVYYASSMVDSLDPARKELIEKTPKDFGKINFADFDDASFF